MSTLPSPVASVATSVAPAAACSDFHLVLGRPLDLQTIADEAAGRNCPRHVMGQLAERLGAEIQRPEEGPVRPADRLRARLSSRPEHWTQARRVAARLAGNRDAVVFCTGEDVGVPTAALCRARGEGPRMAVFIHNIDRPRGRLALRWWRMAERVDLFVTNAQRQEQFLRRYLRLPAERVWRLLDQTDTRFFTPGPPSPGKRRPIVASVGLEQRDYRTLALATADLDLDVKISGFSRDAVALRRAFPEPMPANMTRDFYPWPELVQLYRDADVIVVSVFENNYSAGINALLEAMSCRRPVVVTGTQGLTADYLRGDVAVVVPPGDPRPMRAAVQRLLENPQEADALAERGHRWVLEHHNSERYCEQLARRLEQLRAR